MSTWTRSWCLGGSWRRELTALPRFWSRRTFPHHAPPPTAPSPPFRFYLRPHSRHYPTPMSQPCLRTCQPCSDRRHAPPRRCCRLPATTRFCAFHPVKLFDFSTRARCLTPFRVLGLSGPGAAQPQNSPLCMDLEAVPALSAAQLAWHREETAKLEDELHQVRIVGIAPRHHFTNSRPVSDSPLCADFSASTHLCHRSLGQPQRLRRHYRPGQQRNRSACKPRCRVGGLEGGPIDGAAVACHRAEQI